jgi:hypothetical protein
LAECGRGNNRRDQQGRGSKKHPPAQHDGCRSVSTICITDTFVFMSPPQASTMPKAHKQDLLGVSEQHTCPCALRGLDVSDRFAQSQAAFGPYKALDCVSQHEEVRPPVRHRRRALLPPNAHSAATRIGKANTKRRYRLTMNSARPSLPTSASPVPKFISARIVGSPL